MTVEQMDILLERIATNSDELYKMIALIQAADQTNTSNAWLQIFDTITHAWFRNDDKKLTDIANFINFGDCDNISPKFDSTYTHLRRTPLTFH